MLERHEIEAFLVLADELHFGRTAERLHVSTARVSQTVRKLERRFGAPLFVRTSRRVEPTALGAQLAAELRPAWEAVGAAVRRVADAGHGRSGTLRVAFGGPAAGQLLAGVAERFRERLPGWEATFREAELVDRIALLRSGEVDLVFAEYPLREPDLMAGPVLVSEPRMLALPAGHRLARLGAVTAERLADLPLVQLPSAVPQSFRADRTPTRTPAGRPIPPGPAGTTLNEILTLVGAGRGAFPVGAQARRYHPRPDVAYRPLTDAPPVQWGLLHHRDHATPATEAFHQAAQELLGVGAATDG
ncbi:LysR family transcriptional regulator [Streptomyces sp. SP17BM10]|uniref:LysR family transcriptional regulator n=1 Tax=Streptomyces sp. SP17BM10 TaxID=3002530 RepID=UPI002E77A5F0|nr:LysR family transcriptional regulator [Streptomyces sp. SP17BM10]MEE1782656.1 LysR family transcriptional regulator [Streptomyces sp. SP17BM10]